MDIEKSYPIWQENPPRSKRTPRVYLRIKNQGFKFVGQKEQGEGCSLMEKAEWIEEKKSFFCHYRKLSDSWKEAYLMLCQKPK
ncbi:hypothetical protein [Enterococcus sp. AZ128]